jgi:phosphoribosylglycinamide formyltransferase-1
MPKKQPAPKPISKRKNVLGDPVRLKKLLELAKGLPEVVIELAGEQHLALKVRKKTFAWYLDSHHDDGIVCLCAKNTRARQGELIAAHGKRYFYPPYVGPSGWVSLRLDQPELDWGEVTALLIEAYRLQAPKRLAEEIG